MVKNCVGCFMRLVVLPVIWLLALRVLENVKSAFWKLGLPLLRLSRFFHVTPVISLRSPSLCFVPNY
jgi:hypothetical protein